MKDCSLDREMFGLRRSADVLPTATSSPRLAADRQTETGFANQLRARLLLLGDDNREEL